MLYRVLIRTDSHRNDIHLLKQCDHGTGEVDEATHSIPINFIQR